MESKPYRPGGGRTPTGTAYPTRLTVPMSEAMRAHLEERASARNVTLAEVVRDLIARDQARDDGAQGGT